MAGPAGRGGPLRNFTADAVRWLGGPDWLRQARLDAYDRFAGSELPTSAEEIWRYSRIDDLDLDRFMPLGPGAATATATGVVPVRPSADVGGRAATIEVVNGSISSVELSPAAAAAGLEVSRFSERAAAVEGLGELATASDPFVAMATAFAADGLIIEVAPGAVIKGPVVVRHLVEGGAVAVALRTLLRAGRSSQVTVVEELASAGSAVLCVPVVEIDLQDAANVDYAGVQILGREAWQLGHQASRVGRDASLRSLTVALGGDYARLRTDSRLTGIGGSSRLLALYFGEGTQMHDFRTLQDHVGPKTTSDLLFKGAVQDEAQGVYSGLIRVAKGASGTNAFQTNRNLVLSEGATAWSVPNLEIEENDVQCSHASAVGPVDEEQQYYLESRGVPPEIASRLIVLGFFEDLLTRAPAPGLHVPLRSLISEKLGRLALDVGHRD